MFDPETSLKLAQQRYQACMFCGRMTPVPPESIVPREDGAVCDSIRCQKKLWDLMAEFCRQRPL